ncbi:MAG: peptide-methionine (S)-S-oxide reductase MsrA [Dehalococcoidia bacterium]|nr:peptide-methionine (S)-S-oxide reductase MsrA [Dehalococcoidia bacterium]
MEKLIETVVFGAGCFWCIETIFSQLEGVTQVTSGFAGGNTYDPSYMQVCSGTTGHAEVIKVEYDPAILDFKDLLDVFFATHDLTTLNRQGNDVGEQYHSIILYTSPEQKELAEKYIIELDSSREFTGRIVIQIRPLADFYTADNYHQNYYEANKSLPYCRIIISPKLEKFRQKFSRLLKSSSA